MKFVLIRISSITNVISDLCIQSHFIQHSTFKHINAWAGKIASQDDQILQVVFLSMNYNRANIFHVIGKTLHICDQFSFYKSSLNSVFAQLAWNCLTVMRNEYQLSDY